MIDELFIIIYQWILTFILMLKLINSFLLEITYFLSKIHL